MDNQKKQSRQKKESKQSDKLPRDKSVHTWRGASYLSYLTRILPMMGLSGPSGLSISLMETNGDVADRRKELERI